MKLSRFLLAFVAVFTGVCSAVELVPVPSPAARVVDVSGTLTPSEREALEHRLADIEARKGAQIAVLLVNTTQPEAIEQYALRVAEAWKPGRQKEDDGLVFLVAVQDRAVRFETGYGLEGVLPDALANRIIDDLVIPHFKEGNYAAGLDAGVTAVEQVLDVSPPVAQTRPANKVNGGTLQLLLVIAVAAIFILPALLGRILGGFAAGAAVGAMTWMLMGSLVLGAFFGLLALVFGMTGLASLLAAAHLGGMGGGRRGGGFGGFGGGSGGGFGGFGGGSGGGGFGGFGGGSFGGGGASGRW